MTFPETSVPEIAAADSAACGRQTVAIRP